MFRWQCRQNPEPSKHSWELPLQSQGEHSPDDVRKKPVSHLSAAGGRRPSVTRESLVSDGSCLPTTALPSMSKGNVLPSPDAALEQTAPQRRHRARTEHQAVFQAISLLIFNRALLGTKDLGGSWWVPPKRRSDAWCFVFSGPAVFRSRSPSCNFVVAVLKKRERESAWSLLSLLLAFSSHSPLSLCLGSPAAPGT